MKQIIRDVFNELVWKMQFTRLSKLEKERILKLRKEISSLPSIQVDKAFSESERAWLENCIELRKQILWRDPRNFLQWGVVKRTMFHECKQAELDFLKELPNWNSLEAVLIEDPVGNPKRFSGMLTSSGNLIHHLYNVSQFLSVYPVSIQKMPQVVEFGGGYGSMARLFYKMGFSGRYVIFDVPEFAALQEYFLSSLDVSVPVFRKPTKDRGVVILTDIEDFKKQCALDQIDLFIATWSISESPVELREIVLKAVENGRYWLIAYQKQFQDIDNVEYFKKHMSEGQYNWKSFEIVHLPGQYYAFRSKK